jgi:hypothetical protein
LTVIPVRKTCPGWTDEPSTPDGRKFTKSPEILDDFIYTQAYSNLYMSLIADADAAANFVNGIIPKNIADQANAQKAITTK